MFNDKVGRFAQMFKSYVYANGRFLEDHVNLIRSIKANDTLSAAQKAKQIGGELVRATGRVAGMQAAGELERYLAQKAGRENSVLEETLPGRVLANLLYASYFGPLYLIADTIAYRGGLHRPQAIRGGKEEPAYDILELPAVEGFNEAVKMFSPAITSPVRGVAPSTQSDRFDEERDSTTAQVGRAVSRVPAIKQGESLILGPEEAKDLRTRPPGGGGAARPHPLDAIMGVKGGGRAHPLDSIMGGAGGRSHPLDAIMGNGKKGRPHPLDSLYK